MFKSLKLALPIIAASASAEAQDTYQINKIELNAWCNGDQLVAHFSGCAIVPIVTMMIFSPEDFGYTTLTAPSCFAYNVESPQALPSLMQHFENMGMQNVPSIAHSALSNFNEADLICGPPALGS